MTGMEQALPLGSLDSDSQSQVGVPLVLRIDAHRCITEDGLRPGRCHGQELVAGPPLLAIALDHILEVVQLALLLAVLFNDVSKESCSFVGEVGRKRSFVSGSEEMCSSVVEDWTDHETRGQSGRLEQWNDAKLKVSKMHRLLESKQLKLVCCVFKLFRVDR